MTNTPDMMGPISYLVVEFPGNKMTGEGLIELVDLVDRGLIRILDLAFIMKAADGSVAGIELRDIDNDGVLDLTVFEGVSTGMIADSDRNEAGNAIEAGSAAGILIFENCWATRFVRALRNGGGSPVAAGYIPQDDLLAALDASEPA